MFSCKVLHIGIVQSLGENCSVEERKLSLSSLVPQFHHDRLTILLLCGQQAQAEPQPRSPARTLGQDWEAGEDQEPQQDWLGGLSH